MHNWEKFEKEHRARTRKMCRDGADAEEECAVMAQTTQTQTTSVPCWRRRRKHRRRVCRDGADDERKGRRVCRDGAEDESKDDTCAVMAHADECAVMVQTRRRLVREGADLPLSHTLLSLRLFLAPPPLLHNCLRRHGTCLVVC